MNFWEKNEIRGRSGEGGGEEGAREHWQWAGPDIESNKAKADVELEKKI
jgi:hypothetical protein